MRSSALACAEAMLTYAERPAHLCCSNAYICRTSCTQRHGALLHFSLLRGFPYPNTPPWAVLSTDSAHQLIQRFSTVAVGTHALCIDVRVGALQALTISVKVDVISPLRCKEGAPKLHISFTRGLSVGISCPSPRLTCRRWRFFPRRGRPIQRGNRTAPFWSGCRAVPWS